MNQQVSLKTFLEFSLLLQILRHCSKFEKVLTKFVHAFSHVFAEVLAVVGGFGLPAHDVLFLSSFDFRGWRHLIPADIGKIAALMDPRKIGVWVCDKK